MNVPRFILMLALALGVNACATVREPDSVDRQPGLKEKYVYAINRDAETRATRVYWVNYPTDEQVAKRLGLKPRHD